MKKSYGYKIIIFFLVSTQGILYKVFFLSNYRAYCQERSIICVSLIYIFVVGLIWKENAYVKFVQNIKHY